MGSNTYYANANCTVDDVNRANAGFNWAVLCVSCCDIHYVKALLYMPIFWNAQTRSPAQSTRRVRGLWTLGFGSTRAARGVRSPASDALHRQMSII